ncbi:hypothetical protein DOTSEDRAFT_69527 [Dothistroma septosporum NZE10]|uniref:Uncharacterized protein n=1 Tax=Dothistroma septosporum (strain NZE10 / CBS 128990) TaxID=675120 RepID=N1PW71_DOTSN|nr:hypothetical protein DOTSEDRAFT_69527 [Dothistroma septosporum NZE10]
MSLSSLKRKANSPPENPPVRKKSSVSVLAAAAAYGGSIKVAKKGRPGPALRESTSNLALAKIDRGEALKEFGPWEKASTVNNRGRTLRRRESVLTGHGTPLRPGLELAGSQLQTMKGEDIASIKEVLLLPTSLAVIKPNWPFCFDINCTPQLGPALPELIAEDLYQKYVCSSPLLRPGRLPYYHIGTTTIGFRLHFYLVLPNAGGPPHAANTGHLSDEVLQRLFDHCICPALQAAEPKRRGFASWMQAMNEANLKPLKSRKRSAGPEMQEERIHCFHLTSIWEAIEACDDEDVQDLLQGGMLVAYGDVEGHTWHEGWKPTWASWRKDWEGAVEKRFLREESRISVGIDLGVGVSEEGRKGDGKMSRYERNRARH